MWFDTRRYLVFSDPPGAKIGNGGATMFVLQQLEKLLGWEELSKGGCSHYEIDILSPEIFTALLILH